MENLIFAVFAVLPLALASFFSRARGAHAGFGFLAALAPVIASGVSSLVKHKQQKSAEKKQAEYDRKLAEQEAAAERAKFEAAQNSPAAVAARLKQNMMFGRLLGKAGGRSKLPPGLLAMYDKMRATPEYVPGKAYVAPPSSGAGVWDFVGGLTDALGYLDTTKLGKGKAPTSVGQPVTPVFKTGQLSDLLRPKTPGFGSGTQDFG
jgi:hypothetical protein